MVRSLLLLSSLVLGHPLPDRSGRGPAPVREAPAVAAQRSPAPPDAQQSKSAAQTVPLADPGPNLLAAQSGTILVSQPGEYSSAFGAELLTDGSAAQGWCSPQGSAAPWAFVYELEQRSRLRAITVDATGTEESGYPGISAARIELWASDTGADVGFKRLVSAQLKTGARARLALPPDTLARWVKVVVLGNHGRADYTELSELSLEGEALEPRGLRMTSGGWALEGGGQLVLQASGEGALRGCGLLGGEAFWLQGRIEGRAASGSEPTPFALTVDAAGALRLRRGAPGASVTARGARADVALDCELLRDDLALGAQLAQSPLGTVLPGLAFTTEDSLSAAGRRQLQVLAHQLRRLPSRKVRVLALGRTTAVPADELLRCERRAQVVLQALVEAGAPSAQLQTGYGLLKVGAAVSIEPRVELQLLAP